VDVDGINRYAGHGHANAIEHLLQVAVEDLDPAYQPADTRWFLMGNLWVAGDQNVANNSRWLEVRPQRSGSTFTFSYPSGQLGQFDFRTIPGLYQPAGPFVVEQTPRGVVNGSVSSLRVRFNEPLYVPLFNPDVVYLYDTEFNPIPVTDVTPVAGSGDREFTISFPTQFASGYYSLALGLYFCDISGNQPDQNQNGVAGDESDYYFGYFYLAGRQGGAPSGGAELVWGLADAASNPSPPRMLAPKPGVAGATDGQEPYNLLTPVVMTTLEIYNIHEEPLEKPAEASGSEITLTL
jgi:hypothetical protein